MLDRISFGTGFRRVGRSGLVIEAIAEDEAAKTSVFTLLDRIVDSPDTILASNTSSIPIMKLAVATQRPRQVLGIHFFNPVPVLSLVELVPSLLTAEDEVTSRSGLGGRRNWANTRSWPRTARVRGHALLILFILPGHPHAGIRVRHGRGHRRGLVRGAPIPRAPWPWLI